MSKPTMHKDTREATPVVVILGAWLFGCLIGAIVVAPWLARMVAR